MPAKQPSVRERAQANLRTIVQNEDKRLGKVVDRPSLFQDPFDIDEAVAARRGDGLGPRSIELKNAARQQIADQEARARARATTAPIYEKRKKKGK